MSFHWEAMLKKRNFQFHSAFIFLSVVLGFAWADCTSAVTLENQLKTCSYCHGKDGASTDSDVPIIGGYSVEFLVNNLKAYRDHDRDCPETKYRSGPDKGKKSSMCEIAKNLKDGDIHQIATYLSKKKFVHAKQKFDPVLAAKGKDIHDMYCEKCHSEGATQAKDDAGMMAGQWIPYLRQAIDEFQSGKRPIPKKMKAKLDEVTPEDINALIQFYGSYN
ncbi:cytochrome subunit of sulfide dehydrogenase precursor [mine drainage metagenome]|uniref:Cytochrome subunit of sulfide dehydrogenase n=1 Tax=mine drainage metagenome TaxID=410659 RepID=A0A1J5TP41_9ZZZZ